MSDRHLLPIQLCYLEKLQAKKDPLFCSTKHSKQIAHSKGNCPLCDNFVFPIIIFDIIMGIVIDIFLWYLHKKLLSCHMAGSLCNANLYLGSELCKLQFVILSDYLQ